jgi:hypothetical protein
MRRRACALLALVVLALGQAAPTAGQAGPLAVLLSTTASDLERGQAYTATATIWTDADDRVIVTLYTPDGILIEHLSARYGCVRQLPDGTIGQAARELDAQSAGLSIAIQAEAGCVSTIAYRLAVAADAPAGTIAYLQLYAHDDREHRAQMSQSVRVNRFDRYFPIFVPIARR